MTFFPFDRIVRSLAFLQYIFAKKELWDENPKHVNMHGTEKIRFTWWQLPLYTYSYTYMCFTPGWLVSRHNNQANCFHLYCSRATTTSQYIRKLQCVTTYCVHCTYSYILGWDDVIFYAFKPGNIRCGNQIEGPKHFFQFCLCIVN